MPNSNGNRLSISRRKPDVFDQVSQRAAPRDIFDQVAQGGGSGKDIFDQVAAGTSTSQSFVPPDTTAQARAYALRPLTQATAPTDRAMQFGPGGMQFVDVPAGTKASFEKANLAGYQKGGRIGAENVGTLALGEGVAEGIGRLLPSAARAGAKFEAIKAAIAKLPVEGHLDEAAKVAWDTKALAGRGGRLPKVVSDFLRRLYDPKEGPIEYEEARGFYKNARELASEEYGRLNPVMQRQAALFAKALDQGIRKGTRLAGEGERYASAMSEYARAKKLASFGEKVASAGKQYIRGLPYGAGVATGGAALYELYKALL